MSRRIYRFTDQLDVRLKPYLSSNIDIIGKDGRVQHVILHKVDSDQVYGINLRGKKCRFPIKEIQEVILHK